jgi:hypothetical protein
MEVIRTFRYDYKKLIKRCKGSLSESYKLYYLGLELGKRTKNIRDLLY